MIYLGGDHFFQVWAADDKGNMSVPVTVRYHVIDDITPPTATHSISPTDWTRDNVTIHLVATDDRTRSKRYYSS